MRDIIQVMEQMKPFATNKETFEANMKYLTDSIAYTPPEGFGLRWTQLHKYMLEDIPKNETDWTEENYQMVSVFSTHSVEDLKKMIEEDNNNNNG